MTDREILEAAKEEVAKQEGYSSWGELARHHFQLESHKEYQITKAALLALQKQREQIKTELRDKILEPLKTL